MPRVISEPDPEAFPLDALVFTSALCGIHQREREPQQKQKQWRRSCLTLQQTPDALARWRASASGSRH